MIKANKVLARFIANMCIRNNTPLEGLHGGIFPSSKRGDMRDVKVVSPFGEIPWNRFSRISDEEMRELMLKIEENLEWMIEKIIDLYTKGKTTFPVGKDKPEVTLDAFLKMSKEYLFGEQGVSYDIPEEEWLRLNQRKKNGK